MVRDKSARGMAFPILNGLFLTLFCLSILYLMWYVVIISLNDGADSLRGGIYLWPREFTLRNYQSVLGDASLIRAFGVTVLRTLVGTVSSVFFTSMVAYAMSKRHLFGRKLYLLIGTGTMIFSGGLIPYFLLLRSLKLLDTFWVYIIPALFSFYNCIIFMSFFRTIPAALEESANIDGASDWRIFLTIIIPLSKPVLATIALFSGVGHWNDYFSGVVFVNNPDLVPIQTVLYRIVTSASMGKMAVAVPGVAAKMTSSIAIKFATMAVATLPIILVYPFLQKYFVKGVMIGAVKG